MKRLLLLAVIVAIIGTVIRQGRARRNEWHGLTEAEARARLEQRFPGVIPEERRDAMADTIVSKMRDRGVLADDTAPTADTIDLTTPAAASSSEETTSEETTTEETTA